MQLKVVACGVLIILLFVVMVKGERWTFEQEGTVEIRLLNDTLVMVSLSYLEDRKEKGLIDVFWIIGNSSPTGLPAYAGPGGIKWHAAYGILELSLAKNKQWSLYRKSKEKEIAERRLQGIPTPAELIAFHKTTKSSNKDILNWVSAQDWTNMRRGR